jgi:hypothetical protein
MKKKITYTLIKKDIPSIKGRHILHDVRVGGEKLVYKRVTIPIQQIRFFNLFTISVPLLLYKKIKGGIGLDVTTEKVVFLRPYKKNWAHRKERLPFHLWGKKEHPLTNIWLELEYDYEDIINSSPLIKTRIEDITLIKFLRQHEEKFTIVI